MMKPNKYCGKLDVGYGMGWREESGWNREERMTGEERKESRYQYNTREIKGMRSESGEVMIGDDEHLIFSFL